MEDKIKLIGECPSKYGIESFVLSDGRIIPNDQSNIEYNTTITQDGRHKEEWMKFKKENLLFQITEWHINPDGSCDHTCHCNTRLVGKVAEYYTTKTHISNPAFKSFEL